ncbi:MAG: DHHA1 domain-containing protein, partial [Myxococcota bacterium]
GEKYGERVRVVRMGDSVELCGGTHVKSTGEIGIFYIVRESAVASGIRRIEAVCGLGALNLIEKERRILKEVCEFFKVNQENILVALKGYRDKITELEKEIIRYEDRLFSHSLNEIIKKAVDVNGFRLILDEVRSMDVADLRKKMDMIRERDREAIIFLYSKINGKLSIVMSVPKEKTDKIDASIVIKDVLKHIGGTGGGRRDMAQGGTTDLSKIDTLQELVVSTLRKLTG